MVKPIKPNTFSLKMNSIDIKGFKKWVNSISAKYKQSQIKAVIKVNSEMLSFYFELGKEISYTSFKAEYGSKFYDNLSKELIKNLPNVTGLSPVNIRYMERFYLLYKDKIQIFPRLVEELFSIPWGHHRYIIDKCKNFDEILWLDSSKSQAFLINNFKVLYFFKNIY